MKLNFEDEDEILKKISASISFYNEFLKDAENLGLNGVEKHLSICICGASLFHYLYTEILSTVGIKKEQLQDEKDFKKFLLYDVHINAFETLKNALEKEVEKIER